MKSSPQTVSTIPQAITTPDKVDTRLGTLNFKDGAPSAETSSKIYDNLDFTHAFESFVNTFQGVNMVASLQAKIVEVMMVASAEAAWMNFIVPVPWDSVSIFAPKDGRLSREANASGNTLRFEVPT